MKNIYMVADYIDRKGRQGSIVLSFGMYNNLAYMFKHDPYYKYATAITICSSKKEAERIVADREKVNKAVNRAIEADALLDFLKREGIE